ncbi:hypothetical protein CUMW_254750 [Citrus unshiu]|uniref:Protein kinase domain-containing protein n=1 Tax=Citrus unshiu TaxID=55188 RepID=A0A2H5QSE7_CITUN|nr:hypothetical protein CUMW_254750 [Citrus unshiu]
MEGFQSRLPESFFSSLEQVWKFSILIHIIHRDLKPENILLFGLDDDVMLKIADFGLSCTLHPGNYAEKVCGSQYTWLLKFFNFKDMMRRLICGALGQFFLSFLMATHLSLLVRNINSCKHLPFSQLIVPALHPDCVDMCLKLLSANPDIVDLIYIDISQGRLHCIFWGTFIIPCNSVTILVYQSSALRKNFSLGFIHHHQGLAI